VPSLSNSYSRVSPIPVSWLAVRGLTQSGFAKSRGELLATEFVSVLPMEATFSNLIAGDRSISNKRAVARTPPPNAVSIIELRTRGPCRPPSNHVRVIICMPSRRVICRVSRDARAVLMSRVRFARSCSNESGDRTLSRINRGLGRYSLWSACGGHDGPLCDGSHAAHY
jgi:hypothetical protein